MGELKPCPFCGGEAVEGKVKFNGKESEREGWLGCQECRVFMNYMNGERGRKAAIEAWNTRHERTCEVTYGEYGSPYCGECGCVLYSTSGYCPNCGTRIREANDAD